MFTRTSFALFSLPDSVDYILGMPVIRQCHCDCDLLLVLLSRLYNNRRKVTLRSNLECLLTCAGTCTAQNG